MKTTVITPATNKADRVASLRVEANNCLIICRLEMRKAAPDLDIAYEFAYKAMRHIETLRIMTIGGVTA